jgi:uncharacterized integral membrane protein
MRPKPNPPFSTEDPHCPPALDPIYTLDQVFFLFYTFLSRKQPIIGSESGSRTRGGYLIQGERGWKMEAKKGGAMNKRLILILVLVGLALILIFQNTQSVYLHIFFWKLVQPMVVLVVTLFALGFVIGFLAAKMKGTRGEKS